MPEEHEGKDLGDDLEKLTKEELILIVHNLHAGEQKRKDFNRSLTERVGRWALLFFAGPGLYKATKTAWKGWISWLRSPREGNWPEESSGEFVAALLSRILRMSVFSLLVVTAIPIYQTIIFSQQNKLFQQQNERFDRQINQFEAQIDLMVFEQTSKFRDLLFQLPLDAEGNEIVNYQAFPDSIVQWPKAKMSVARSINELSKTQNLLVETTLKNLLVDDNVSVSSGAFLALQLNGNQIATSMGNGNFVVNGLNFHKANFSDLAMFRSNFTGAILSSANFQNTNMLFSSFEAANLSEADLSNARLRGSTFKNSSLFKASLFNADLSFSDLTNAGIFGAELTGAKLDSAVGYTYSQLCSASDLRSIEPDSLRIALEARCPEKFVGL